MPIDTMEYYLALKRNELLICATTWMTLKGMKLGERNLSKVYILFDSVCNTITFLK